MTTQYGLPRHEPNRPDVDMRIHVCTHLGRMEYRYSVPALNPTHAALAYLRLMYDVLGEMIDHRLVVVRCGAESGPVRPLLNWTGETARNFYESDKLNQWLINASYDGASKKHLGAYATLTF